VNVDALTEAVWQRLEGQKPRALLIGAPPENYHNYFYVNQEPFEAIVLGILPPGKLLHMPDETVCKALLDGLPVFLWHDQPHHTGNTARSLRHALYMAEQRLIRYGVQVIGRDRQLITAEMARKMRQNNQLPTKGSRLTPLARDILEGKAT